MSRIFFFTTLLSLAASCGLPAAPPPRGPLPAAALSEREAIAAAWAGNPELRVFTASLAAARGGVTTAKTLANPELSIAPGFRRTREEGSVATEFHGEIALSQLFKFPGKRALEVGIAERNVELQQLALEGVKFQLAAKVRKAFHEGLAAQKIIGLRAEQVRSAATFAEAARRRAESGYASDFETLKSQADLIAAQRAEQQARGEQVAARLTLNTLLGRSPQAPLEITGALETAVPRGKEDDFLALAMARHPSLRVLRKQAEVAGLTWQSTRFGNRPDFAAGPSVEYTPSEQTIGISATMALPLWDRKKGEIATAAAEQRKALAELEKTRCEIAGEVARAAAALQVARAAAGLYTPAFLERLKAFVAQAEQGYAQNATTLIIYLDAKRTYFDTLSDFYEALGKVATSRAELESAVGVPLDANQ